MKKALYIYIGNIDEKSGITNKLHGLFNAFEKKGIEVTLFALSSINKKGVDTSRKGHFLPICYLENKVELYKELGNFIDNNPAFDYYYFRYPLGNSELLKLAKKHPHKFIFEHNTKEVPERREQAIYWVKKFKFRLSPSYAKLLYYQLIKSIFNEVYYGKRVLRLAKKGIAVTNEIAEYEKARCSNYSCSVVSNGIEFGRISLYKREVHENGILNFILLANSNSGWHGIDLIIKSFNEYKGKNIKLFLIGKFDEKDIASAAMNENIVFTGYLLPEDFEKYLKMSHVGLGAFALFRKKLKEASTLKVREYLASGLPVFLGHVDSDVKQSELLKKYVLGIDLRKEQIDWGRVYAWAIGLYLDAEVNKKIRDEAFRQIDFSIKVDQLIDK